MRAGLAEGWWDREEEGRALIDFRDRPNPSTMPPKDPMRNRQPHATPFEFLCPMQFLKHTKKFFRVGHIKARSIVADKIEDLTRFLTPPNLDFRHLLPPRVFQGIGDQIANNLSQQLKISVGGGKVVMLNANDTVGLLKLHVVEGLTHQRIEIDVLP